MEKSSTAAAKSTDDHKIEMKTMEPRGREATPPMSLQIPEREDDQHPSDEEDGFDAGDAESMVGVSLGREQSRLMSPSTPAAEKSAALDRTNAWGFFEGAEEEGHEEMLLNTLQNSTIGDTGSTEHRPGLDRSNDEDRVVPPLDVTAHNPSEHSNAAPDPLITSGQSLPSRPRTSVTSFLGDTGIKRFMSHFSFPSLPEPWMQKNLPALSFGSAKVEATASGTRRVRSNSLFLSKLQWTGGNTHSRSRSGSSHFNMRPSRADAIPQAGRARASSGVDTPRGAKTPSLRRSASENSILRPSISRQSTFSRSSILGDDRDWDHIKDQVNSRRRAIKDAFQDSLPQMPQMPNISLSSFKPELPLRMLRELDRPLQKDGSGSNADGTSARRENAQNTGSEAIAGSPMKMYKSRSPSLDEVLERLTGDVVIMGGYRGSVLRSSEPPYRQLWVPVKVGLNIRRVNLEVGLDHKDEEQMHKSIFASEMLSHIGPVDMSRRLFKKLRGCENARKGVLRVWDYAYDWRLSPALLSERLTRFLETLESRKRDKRSPPGALVIAHSLGGLITRHVVNKRPELFSGVLYAGTPQHCVNILGPLRNGDDVLLSSKVLTAQVNFTFRTSFLLLPESGRCFFNRETREQYPVDFFDADSWQRYAWSPCVAPSLPPYNAIEKKSIFDALSNSIPSLLSSGSSFPSLKPPGTVQQPSSPPEESTARKAENLANPSDSTVGMQMQTLPPSPLAGSISIPPQDAMAYLRRTLPEILRFKRELRHNSTLEEQNRYPPHAIMYGASVPTVYGARVACREAIQHSDAYDELAFASGDGVVLARAAMVPRGYRTVDGGRVCTERGHVALLGDLEAVGKCLLALERGRNQGVGLGPQPTAPHG